VRDGQFNNGRVKENCHGEMYLAQDQEKGSYLLELKNKTNKFE